MCSNRRPLIPIRWMGTWLFNGMDKITQRIIIMCCLFFIFVVKDTAQAPVRFQWTEGNICGIWVHNGRNSAIYITVGLMASSYNAGIIYSKPRCRIRQNVMAINTWYYFRPLTNQIYRLLYKSVHSRGSEYSHKLELREIKICRCTSQCVAVHLYSVAYGINVILLTKNQANI